MFHLDEAPFGDPTPRADPEIIFVADLFVEDYVGGAELTSEALIVSSPLRVEKVRSKDLTSSFIERNVDKFWIFGNFTGIDANLFPLIIGNLRYSVLEYDYKFCVHRSPEKHRAASQGKPCDCHRSRQGDLISTFLQGSMGVWWMSAAQRDRYLSLFPRLSNKRNVVLSSVFDPRTLQRISELREKNRHKIREGWLVLGSPSWIKGFENARSWCVNNRLPFETIWDVPYDQLLQKLATAHGYVYLPLGGDTCPRTVIEAKLLGCELVINENVQHREEPWFATADLQEVEDYLRGSPERFWTGIKEMMNHRPTISGYVTTYNCVKQQYPFEACIRSMLSFCDEVCVVDGGSTDETLVKLAELAYPQFSDPRGETRLRSLVEFARTSGEASWSFPDEFFGSVRDPRLHVKIVWRDWEAPHHPVFDGMQKAAARAMCTKEFCWQMDSDEIVHEDDAPRIRDLCRHVPAVADVLCLPVTEFWGSEGKVRIDVPAWKWRLSRNYPHVTHGIPVNLRRFRPDGTPYALPGTDGCDMIDATTGERLPCASFYTQEVENLRRMALLGDQRALKEFETWFRDITKALPGVFHYSWYDLRRKVQLYRDYWQNHWVALYGGSTEDTAENNMFFDVPWSQVTDAMIDARVEQLRTIGGWVWHRKWHGERTPWITIDRSEPALMQP